MPGIIPETPPGKTPGWLGRVGWFIALYVLGVASVGIVAYGLRLWIKS